MTLNISPEIVQSRIQLCKEWIEAPVKMKAACKRLFTASMEVLSSDELADFYFLFIKGRAKKYDQRPKPTAEYMACFIESMIKPDAAERWAEGLKVHFSSGLPQYI